MSILVIAEHDNNALNPSTLHTVSAALQLHQPVKIIVIGYHCGEVAKQAAGIHSVAEIICVDDEVYQFQLAENTAALLAKIGKEYEYIVAPATTFGKNILPRLAALLNVAPVTDVITIIDGNTFVRPIYAGNAWATIKSLDATKLLTIRCTAFSPAHLSGSSAPINIMTQPIPNSLSKFIAKTQIKKTTQDLTTAKIVVAGGRGLQNQENFKLIEELATLLGGALGASRAAVDAGYVANECQVGQTGKVVAPDLYIAIGISGAIQHVAGMKDSKIIVAINKDSDAPIFQIADFGLVADFMSIYPDLMSELQAAKKID